MLEILRFAQDDPQKKLKIENGKMKINFAFCPLHFAFSLPLYPIAYTAMMLSVFPWCCTNLCAEDLGKIVIVCDARAKGNLADGERGGSE